MLSELVTLYSLDDSWANPYSYSRKAFYDEQVIYAQEWKTPTVAVGAVNVVLVNMSWELIIQKRSSHKRHNPNLLDKSIWWHIVWWDTVDYTVMVETLQELQVPSIVIKRNDDFTKRYELLRDYTSTVAIIKHIDTKIIRLDKIINDKTVPVFNKTHLYFWVYGWSIKNVDREAKWILYYSLEELKDEMKTIPSLFTYDLHHHIKQYWNELETFIESLIK